MPRASPSRASTASRPRWSITARTRRATRSTLALADAIDAGEPDVIVLAGFMRVLGSAFVRRYEGRMINIHPSLLPLYPGLHTHRRALDDGVRVHGCTVHYVSPDVDRGPIIAQGVVPVVDGDDESIARGTRARRRASAAAGRRRLALRRPDRDRRGPRAR